MYHGLARTRIPHFERLIDPFYFREYHASAVHIAPLLSLVILNCIRGHGTAQIENLRQSCLPTSIHCYDLSHFFFRNRCGTSRLVFCRQKGVGCIGVAGDPPHDASQWSPVFNFFLASSESHRVILPLAHWQCSFLVFFPTYTLILGPPAAQHIHNAICYCIFASKYYVLV